MIRRLTIWQWCGLAFVAVVAIIAAMLRIDGLHACQPQGDPILQFELVKTPGEVAALFPSACSAQAGMAQARGLWLDSLAFIPAYGAALILALLALGQDAPARRGFARAGVLLVLVAIAYDQWENSRLLAVLASLPGDQATIDQLVAAPRIKFALLGVVEGMAGWLILGLGGWRRLAGLAAMGGGALTLLGLAGQPLWIASGGPIAFTAIAVTAWSLWRHKVSA